MSDGMKITGLVEIQAKLKTLAPRVANKVVRQSLRAGAKIVQKQTAANAPVHTGLTAHSVKVRAIKRTKGMIGVAVQIGKGSYLGETYYAAFVEFGTAHNPPQHFMQRAYDATKEKVVKQLETEIKSGIEKEAER
jgi:HK97 gp10 family phage protein